MIFTRERVAEGLRNVAGRDQHKRAAAELLIQHGTWVEAWSADGELSPKSANNVGQFTTQVMAPTPGDLGTPFVNIGWARMAEHLQTAGHTYSKTEVKMFRLAASLWAGLPVNLQDVTTGLDPEHSRRVAETVIAAVWPAGSSGVQAPAQRAAS
ncbi:hypothetical protein ACIRPQ_29015 [Streptomyces sp. NPDC101213]|uniref:hypothetical protein n=1 Tax=Streptomyces sp. NPDC101213 TaxID=3366130 RepID=UPI00381E284C